MPDMAESVHTKQNKQINLMQQIMLISNWIHKFDAYKFDDRFEDH